MSLLHLLLFPALLSTATATVASASVCQRSAHESPSLALENLLGDGRHPESPLENHLFIARIRTLSDHLFFVVVPWDCAREVCN